MPCQFRWQKGAVSVVVSIQNATEKGIFKLVFVLFLQ